MSDEIFEPVEQKKYTVKTADKLDNTPVEWLIDKWIPMRGITLLFGDGGTGKSYLWGSLVSALSKGLRTILSSKSSNEEKRILCLSGEDAECILRARLEKLNAKLTNVYVIAQDSEQPDITFKNGELDKIVEDVKPGILILDPLQSFIGADVDMARRNSIRPAMKPLLDLSAKYNMPVVIVCHSNKRESAENGRDKLADSADLWDIARSVIMVGFSEGDTRFISLEKSSYADHLNVPTVLFSIENGLLAPRGECSMKLRDFVRDRKGNRSGEVEKTDTQKSRCEDKILELLADGQTDAGMLNDLLEREGFGEKAIRYGKKSLKDNGLIEMTRYKDGSASYKLVEMP